MKKTISEALLALKEANAPILSNPFTGKKGEGYEKALEELAKSLFGGGQQQAGGSMQSPQNSQLKPIPQESQTPQSQDQQQDQQKAQDQQQQSSSSQDQSNQNQQQDQEQSSDQQNASQASKQSDDQKDKKSAEQKKDINDLSKQDLADLVDKIQQARDKAKDVINDAGERIDKETADTATDALSDLEKEARTAKDKEDAEKLKARLQAIKDFLDNPEVEKSATADAEQRKEYKKLQRELAREKNAKKQKDSTYPTLNIDEIKNNIVRTLRNETRQVRDSSWNRYNDRASQLGYVAPGRYTSAKRDVPTVVFFFDVSGSWCSNKEKIDMGHRIEEALKLLHNQGKIKLVMRYFGGRVHDKFTLHDQMNSDAPIPYAKELLAMNELDNIIIMTDSDPYSTETLTVPGYAWLLFYDRANENFAANVSGRKGTSIYMIDHE